MESNRMGSNQRLNKSGLTMLQSVSLACAQISSAEAFIRQEDNEFVSVLFMTPKAEELATYF